MKILVVSDTHGRDANLECVFEREKPFDTLIHCGDVEGREFFIEAAAECPSYIVAGNNDYFSDLEREMEFTLRGKRVLLTHGHAYGVGLDTGRLAKEGTARGADLVLFGHTHKPYLETEGGVTLFNPGSLVYPRQEGRLPSYGVIETEGNGELQFSIRYLEK